MSDSQRLTSRSQDVYGIPGLRFPSIDYVTSENPGMAGGNTPFRLSVDTNCAQSTMIADSHTQKRRGARTPRLFI